MYRNKFVVTEEMLRHTPSREDGCPVDLEADLRTTGCDQIQIAGQMLNISHVATSTAQVLFQRYFCVRSFLKFSLLNVAMACICLAIEPWENERLAVEVVNAFHNLRKKERPTSKYVHGEEEPDAATLAELERNIHDNEFYILSDFGFNTNVDLPHQLFFNILTKLKLTQNKRLIDLTWSYLNDNIRANVAERFTPATLACASIKLAASLLKVPLTETPPWWTEFGANLVDMQAANVELMKLRARPRHSLNDLQKRLSEVKEKNRKVSEFEATQHLPSSTSAQASCIFRPLLPTSSPAVGKEICLDKSNLSPHEVLFTDNADENQKSVPSHGGQAPNDSSTVAMQDSAHSLKTGKRFSIICRHFTNLTTHNSAEDGPTDINCPNATTEVNCDTQLNRSVVRGRRAICPILKVLPSLKRKIIDQQTSPTVEPDSILARTCILDTKKKCCRIALPRTRPTPLLPTTMACSALRGKRKRCRVTLPCILPQPQTKKVKLD